MLFGSGLGVHSWEQDGPRESRSSAECECCGVLELVSCFPELACVLILYVGALLCQCGPVPSREVLPCLSNILFVWVLCLGTYACAPLV